MRARRAPGLSRPGPESIECLLPVVVEQNVAVSRNGAASTLSIAFASAQVSGNANLILVVSDDAHHARRRSSTRRATRCTRCSGTSMRRALRVRVRLLEHRRGGRRGKHRHGYLVGDHELPRRCTSSPQVSGCGSSTTPVDPNTMAITIGTTRARPRALRVRGRRRGPTASELATAPRTDHAVAPGAGWTAFTNANTAGDGVTGDGYIAEFQDVTSAGTSVTATTPTSPNWIQIVLLLSPAAGRWGRHHGVVRRPGRPSRHAHRRRCSVWRVHGRHVPGQLLPRAHLGARAPWRSPGPRTPAGAGALAGASTVTTVGAATISGGSVVPQFVQATGGQSSTSSTTFTQTFGSNVGAGSLIVVGMDTNCETLVGITDSFGSTYHLAVTSAVSSLYYAYNVTGGACTVTTTWGNSDFVTVIIAEYSGAKQSGDPLDATNSGDGTGTLADAGGLTTTAANEIQIAYFDAPNQGANGTDPWVLGAREHRVRHPRSEGPAGAHGWVSDHAGHDQLGPVDCSRGFVPRNGRRRSHLRHQRGVHRCGRHARFGTGTLAGTSTVTTVGGGTPAAAKRVYLTSGTIWTVPTDWTSVNTIEVLAAAGGDGDASVAAGGGSGGGEVQPHGQRLAHDWRGYAPTQIEAIGSDSWFDGTSVASSIAGAHCGFHTATSGTGAASRRFGGSRRRHVRGRSRRHVHGQDRRSRAAEAEAQRPRAATAGAGGGAVRLLARVAAARGALSATAGVSNSSFTGNGSAGGTAQDGTAGGAGGSSGTNGSPGSHGSGWRWRGRRHRRRGGEWRRVGRFGTALVAVAVGRGRHRHRWWRWSVRRWRWRRRHGFRHRRRGDHRHHVRAARWSSRGRTSTVTTGGRWGRRWGWRSRRSLSGRNGRLGHSLGRWSARGYEARPSPWRPGRSRAPSIFGVSTVVSLRRGRRAQGQGALAGSSRRRGQLYRDPHRRGCPGRNVPTSSFVGAGTGRRRWWSRRLVGGDHRCSWDPRWIGRAGGRQHGGLCRSRHARHRVDVGHVYRRCGRRRRAAWLGRPPRGQRGHDGRRRSARQRGRRWHLLRELRGERGARQERQPGTGASAVVSVGLGSLLGGRALAGTSNVGWRLLPERSPGLGPSSASRSSRSAPRARPPARELSQGARSSSSPSPGPSRDPTRSRGARRSSRLPPAQYMALEHWPARAPWCGRLWSRVCRWDRSGGGRQRCRLRRRSDTGWRRSRRGDFDGHDGGDHHRLGLGRPERFERDGLRDAPARWSP